jgi:hypothetical protein
MQTVSEAIRSPYSSAEPGQFSNESAVSGVSWPAVFAGTFVALAISLVLVAIASGIGLASISPWYSLSSSATTFTVVTAIGLVVVHWVSAGMGGYITGRLRTKWVGLHTHEVFFRDTANGFVTWALATIVGAVFLASAASSVISGGVHAAATIGSGAAQAAGQVASGAAQGAAHPGAMSAIVSGYDVDSLFRSANPTAGGTSGANAGANAGGSAGNASGATPSGTAGGNAGGGDFTGEATRILAQGVTTGDVPAADKTYLAQLVASHAGISQADAEKRVDAVIAREKAAEAKAKQAADEARKAASAFSIGTALAMLIGAFIACVASAYGGSLRDEH